MYLKIFANVGKIVIGISMPTPFFKPELFGVFLVRVFNHCYTHFLKPRTCLFFQFVNIISQNLSLEIFIKLKAFTYLYIGT